MTHGWQKPLHEKIPLAGGMVSMCMRMCDHECIPQMMTTMFTLNTNMRA